MTDVYYAHRMEQQGGHSLAEILRQLESAYGAQEACWPTEPYDFLVWWHCGYPASDARCAKGWESLRAEVGIEPAKLIAAGVARITQALEESGMVPELRAARLLEIAVRVQDVYAGDLRSGLKGAMPAVRKVLKSFPNIGDPGADRILLFAGIAPVAAVPSNCPHVLVRIERGRERENYNLTYREAQESVELQVPATFDARMRAYLLLKQHGQAVCKRTQPKCDVCAVRSDCAFFGGKSRGRSDSSRPRK